MTFEEAVEKMIEHCRQIVEETPEEIGWEFKEIAEALSSPPARSARDEAIERTATLLRNRLRSIAERPDFKTVFDIARAHGVPYAGPNWEGEERNLSEALSSPPARSARDEAIERAAAEVLADHRERKRVYSDYESQPNRVRVMQNLNRALTMPKGEPNA